MSKHIIRHAIRENPKYRVFCFPYAGGSAAVYRTWNIDFPQEIEVCAVEIPGRIQLRTPPAQNLPELIDAILPDMEVFLDKPFVFFGHSFGAIIAYEVAKRFQQENKPLPEHLWLSSRRAPQLPLNQASTYQLDDEAFIEAMQRQYNAIPPQILNEKELLNLLLPILKADIRINEMYVGELNPVLNIPLTIMHGLQDNSISREQLQQWSAVTSASSEILVFAGGHFFIDAERKSLTRKIVEKINLSIL